MKTNGETVWEKPATLLLQKQYRHVLYRYIQCGVKFVCSKLINPQVMGVFKLAISPQNTKTAIKQSELNISA
jgi:hypothetical protein